MRKLSRISTPAAFAAVTAAAMLALGVVPADAATKAASKTAAKPAAAKTSPMVTSAAGSPVQDAMTYLRVLIAGLEAPKVEEPAKNALAGCIYNNSLSKISEAMDKVIAENPGKIDKKNGNQLLGLMVRICGYHPEEHPAAAGTAPTGPAPTAPAASATSSSTTTGR